MDFFSDQELGKKEPSNEEISIPVWNGLIAIFESLTASNALSYNFPDMCPDYGLVSGFNQQLFNDTLQAQIPNVSVPIQRIDGRRSKPNPWESEEEVIPVAPDKYVILDFLQFCFHYITDIDEGDWHSYYRHNHLRFADTTQNKSRYQHDINAIFERNGIVFYLDEKGNVKRRIPNAFAGIFRTNFNTSDPDLNKLLNEATSHIVLPRLTDRIRGLEKLWDSFERAKTYYSEKKHVSAEQLLNETAKNDIHFKDILTREAAELTRIGNNFQIRHFEKGKIPITQVEHIDYLFFRMFALIDLFLKTLEKPVASSSSPKPLSSNPRASKLGTSESDSDFPF